MCVGFLWVHWTQIYMILCLVWYQLPTFIYPSKCGISLSFFFDFTSVHWMPVTLGTEVDTTYVYILPRNDPDSRNGFSSSRFLLSVIPMSLNYFQGFLQPDDCWAQCGSYGIQFFSRDSLFLMEKLGQLIKLPNLNMTSLFKRN